MCIKEKEAGTQAPTFIGRKPHNSFILVARVPFLSRIFRTTGANKFWQMRQVAQAWFFRPGPKRKARVGGPPNERNRQVAQPVAQHPCSPVATVSSLNQAARWINSSIVFSERAKRRANLDGVAIGVDRKKKEKEKETEKENEKASS